MKSGLQYLTVQDFIWINLQTSGKVNPFDFAALEDSVSLQYGYGKSLNLFSQAAGMFMSLIKRSPFAEANRATAIVGLAAFLKVNGFEFKGTPSKVIEALNGLTARDPGAILNGLCRATSEHEDHHAPSVRDAAGEILKDFGKAISSLKELSAGI